MKIYMFKTNILTASDKRKVKEALSLYNGIYKWHVDLTHPYNVLHVEGYGVTAQKIIASIMEAGFLCAEMVYSGG